MERKRRRLWTFAISAAAALVIAAAVGSGLFQLAILAVPGYRAEIEKLVVQAAGRPVRLGALSLTWRYYYPALEIQNAALLGSDGATAVLEAERMRLGFSLARLVRGDFIPVRLELHGLTVDARYTRDGRVEVDGLSAGGADADPRTALRDLETFTHLRLERCRLNLLDVRRGETWALGIASAGLTRGLLGISLDAELSLPAQLGETAQLEGSITGDWLEPASWSGHWGVKLKGLAAGSWLTPYLARGSQVEFSAADLLFTGKLEQGRPTTMDLRLRTGPLTARRAQHKAGLDSLDAHVQVEFMPQGWQATLKQFELESAQGSWPATSAELVYTQGDDPLLEGRLEFLRLADLAPWLRMVRTPGALGALGEISGDLHETQFRVQGRDFDELRYSVQAQFEALALPAADRAAGIRGARGEFSADESGGRAIFSPAAVTLEFPGLLISENVPFETLEGELEWRRQASAWKLNAPRFQWTLLTTRGDGRLELLLPDDAGRSPEINLNMKFSADDVTAAKPLMPKHWGPGLIDWLDRSIVSGRVPAAELTITGRLADFPFDGKPGIFALDIEAQDVLLAYQPDWPPVEQLGARLSFRGNSLTINGASGLLSGNLIKTVVARFPDFSNADLIVDGTVEGETARFYDFLSRSPLRKTLAGLLRSTTAHGPASVDVHLDIPLKEASGTRARGVVSLGGVELRHASLPEPVKNIEGRISFGGKGVASERLSGSLFEQSLLATMTPKSDGSSLLLANFRFTPDASAQSTQGVNRFIPAWLRSRLKGASDWRAELVIGGDETTPVKLSSNLTGTEIKLPPPLGKPPEAPLPLTLTIGDAPGAPLRITVDYLDRFGADLRFVRSGKELNLAAGGLRVGSGPLPEAPKSGVSLGGVLPELDVRLWAEELSGSGLEQQTQLFQRADLTLGRATWGPYALAEIRYQWQPQKNGWTLALSGSGAAGELRWNPQNRGLLTARLEKLALNYSPLPEEAEPVAPVPAAGVTQKDQASSALVTEGNPRGTHSAAPLDPNQLPRFDLDVAWLSLNQANLGKAALVTERTERGQKIQTLNVAGAQVTLSGEGEWRRRAEQSSATMNFSFAGADVGRLLRAMDYTATLEAKASSAKAVLRWRPAAGGLEWQQAQGTVNLNFTDGQLRAVKPGVGRVLGLFNFYALPRRLTLNFKDVLESGLAFDRIQGDFNLNDGNAYTENLQIAGPSLRMDLRGRIGLAARDYDQSVTVYPDVSAGVTLGALALGGPVAGVLALIAQELLNKPLDQVTRLAYRVTGSWDNPQVERAGDSEPADERRSGPPSQNP